MFRNRRGSLYGEPAESIELIITECCEYREGAVNDLSATLTLILLMLLLLESMTPSIASSLSITVQQANNVLIYIGFSFAFEMHIF